MSKKAFEKIAEGLREAISIAHGQSGGYGNQNWGDADARQMARARREYAVFLRERGIVFRNIGMRLGVSREQARRLILSEGRARCGA